MSRILKYEQKNTWIDELTSFFHRIRAVRSMEQERRFVIYLAATQ